VEWHQFQWYWVTPNPNVVSTPLFNIKYLRNCTKQRHGYNEILVGTYALLNSVNLSECVNVSDVQWPQNFRWLTASHDLCDSCPTLSSVSISVTLFSARCWLKAYKLLYWLFGPKNPSFRNKSGKTQPIRTKFGTRGHVKGWQLPENFWGDRPILGKMAAGTSSAEPEFFCVW